MSLPPLSACLRRRGVLGWACLGLIGIRRTARAATMSIAELYGPVTAGGIQLSTAAQALLGKTVTVTGFMAPPLKAEADFFVLTRYPNSTCPFCSNAADWPVDIVFVRLGRSAEMATPSYAIQATGVLEQGLQVDPATGFLSLVRLVDATWRNL
jgi:hypothetical protein